MTFKHPHTYGLMALVSKKDNSQFDKYRKNLIPYSEFFMEQDFVQNIAPQHISLCYFSYPEKYSKSYVKKLVPKIVKRLKTNIPLKIKVKGLKGWWELDVGFPVIFWNITNFGNIAELRNSIVKDLSNSIEHFKDKNMDFTPHIGVSLAKKEFEKEIRKIVDKSKKDPEIELTLDRIFIFYPEGPEEIKIKD